MTHGWRGLHGPATMRLALVLTAALVAAAAVVAPKGVANHMEPADESRDRFDGFVGGALGGQGGMFVEPSDVAYFVGERGDQRDDRIFVVEAGGNARVQRLDADGNFELMWGRDVVQPGAPGNRGSGFERCLRAKDCKEALPGGRSGEMDEPTGIAVDQRTGNVLVMDLGNRRVQVFDNKGVFEQAWGVGVATGAARWETCTTDCRPGRRGAPSGFADTVNGSISVAPGGMVFATDGSGDRVLQFRSDGDLVRTWDFPDERVRHVAAGGDGVVFASVDAVGGRVARFLPASGRRMAPLTSEEGELTSGRTLGLDIDPGDGSLVVVRNPFGTMVVDVVARPGSEHDGKGQAPARSTIDPLDYVDSVNGVGASPDGAVLIAKSGQLNVSDPADAFDDCRAVRGSTACHGLIVAARRSEAPQPEATILGSTDVRSSSATLTGVVAPGGGAAQMRLQVSPDGVTWRDVGPVRTAISATPRHVVAEATGLRPATAYLVRMTLGIRASDDLESESITSSVWPIVTLRLREPG